MNSIRRIVLLGMGMLLTACSVELSTVTATPQALKPRALRSQLILAVPHPLPWADLHLGGSLVLVQDQTQLLKLDLASGATTTLYQAPNNTWISSAAASPDGKQVVFAYAPPPDQAPQAQYLPIATQIYGVPADGSASPQILIKRTDPDEEFTSPQWSADGRYLYYTHIVPTHADRGPRFKNLIERRAYPNGQPEVLVQDAMWPRLSPDGSNLAYVSVVSTTNSSDLYLANADGKNPKRLVSASSFLAVDAPMISPDGGTVLFSAASAATPPSSMRSPLDQLFGVQVVLAHPFPADWWRISANGGSPEQLTKLGSTGLYGDFSPDGRHIVFLSAGGVYFMNPDGTGLVQILEGGPTGTITWIH